jgi:hypothetical protein
MGYFHLYEIVFYVAVNVWGIVECLRLSESLKDAQKHPQQMTLSPKNSQLLRTLIKFIWIGKAIAVTALCGILISRELISEPGVLEAARDARPIWTTILIIGWISIDAETSRFIMGMRKNFTPKISVP